ncbi:MAG: UvrD-helicase domain-containing protein, partial [Bacteroidales bacterium]
IRAFARDIGLHSGFDIELDHTAILESAVDRMIDSASDDTRLRNWLIMYARASIEDEKGWDLRKSIYNLSQELFKEKFKLLSQKARTELQDKEFLASYIRDLRAIARDFSDKLKELGKKCLSIYSASGLSDDMFFHKSSGVPGFIRSLAEGVFRPPNSYVQAIESNPPRWTTGAVPAPLQHALSAGLEDLVREALHFYRGNIIYYNTARAILSNIFTLGILSDVLSQIRQITRDENIFLLSDAGELIYLITEQDQAPFIYERVGNTYENYMIDEFQDTSTMQWNNFSQLIGNSMAQGFDSLVVGDIKQSIYRWRNSNWQTLHGLVSKADNERFRSEPLKTNWRSRSAIIRFNNTLFTIIPGLLDAEIGDDTGQQVFTGLYSGAVQDDPGRKDNGYVRLEFVPDTDESCWKDSVLDRLPGIIESVQDKGFSASDIGIIVRDNREGSAVLQKIIEYRSALPAEKRELYNFSIVSADSLLLGNSPAIGFIISLLRVLDNPADDISRAAMLRFGLLAAGRIEVEKIPIMSDDLAAFSENYFPAHYRDFLETVRHLPLWDVTERSIGFFGLGDHPGNVMYLNGFQDIVIKFSSGANPGIRPFLEWWDTEGVKKSASLPGQQNSIRVLTIHKAKGLEFKVVILPFISWNLDHKPFQKNILWVSPEVPPFNRLGIVPVKYGSSLSDTIFARQYFDEKYSAYLDNINLLYVAFTRAIDALYGFAPESPKASKIASVLKEAVSSRDSAGNLTGFIPGDFYDPANNIFEYGEMPAGACSPEVLNKIDITRYPVSDNIDSIRLRLHWDSYFINDSKGSRSRINYGKLMHEIFQEILTPEDIVPAVRKKILEGKVTEADEAGFTAHLMSLLSKPDVSSWFAKDAEVLTEASILLPGGYTRRPDRIIFRDGKTIIIDFKFGEENPHHLSQLRQYRNLINSMGYLCREAYLWYVDADKIVAI